MRGTKTKTALATAFAGVVALALWGFPGAADAAATAHSVTPSSETNYSSAVEQPTWSFSCNSASSKWTFKINDVQIIDSTGHTWNDSQGPWSIGIFASRSAGPVPFNASMKLSQNHTNGLFEAAKSATTKNADAWCVTGASVTVDGFSNEQQPLLLDGTLG